MEKPTRLHLEIQKQGERAYGVLRTSYREGKKVRHTTHGRLSGIPYSQLKLIQAALQGKAVLADSENAPKVTDSKEYGASYSILNLARELGLDKIIYSKPEQQWVKDSLAMIIGRLVYAGSKLSLSNRYKDTALWELLGVDGAVDVEEHCYDTMDRLLQRQRHIQQKLAAKHFKGNALVLYDITSSYFEGEYADSHIVKFGYNRDRKRGKEQIVIGLICTDEGCPIGVEVFEGNTKDETTVVSKIEEIQSDYGVQELIFVGDRGMVTQANIEKVTHVQGLNWISALTHPQIKKLLERDLIQLGLFDENKIIEIIDPEEPEKRYCLCRNEDSARRETATRQALLDKTCEALDRIAGSNRKSTTPKVSARVGRTLKQWKMGKFVKWTVEDGRLEWSLDQDLIDTEQLLDGCYIIASDVSEEKMDKQEIVSSYKKLMHVEKAFRNLKTVQLEMRPIYHKTDDRIRCHVFICMLAYYLQWHMVKRLQPLFDSDGARKHRFWTFENVIERLKSIRRENMHMAGAVCKIVSTPDKDQLKLLNLLQIKL